MKKLLIVCMITLSSTVLTASDWIVRAQGVAIGTLIGAGLGYQLYCGEKQAFEADSSLNKKPKKWHTYVLKGAAMGGILGLGAAQSKIWIGAIKENIKIRLEQDRIRIEKEAQENALKDLKVQFSNQDAILLKMYDPETFKKLSDTLSISPFDLLGVPITASPAEIEKAHRKLAMKYHPDKCVNNPQKSKLMTPINEAKTAITECKNGNQQARQTYY